MNQVYFGGYGCFKVNTDDFDKAEDELLIALADAGIDFILDLIELQDEDGNEIEQEELL